jgi:hypothetical protein
MEEDKILLGHTRPDFEEMYRKICPAVLVCACGQHLFSREGCYQHWQMGHCDTPVYATRDEMIKAKLNQLQERRARAL